MPRGDKPRVEKAPTFTQMGHSATLAQPGQISARLDELTMVGEGGEVSARCQGGRALDLRACSPAERRCRRRCRCGNLPPVYESLQSTESTDHAWGHARAGFRGARPAARLSSSCAAPFRPPKTLKNQGTILLLEAREQPGLFGIFNGSYWRQTLFA